MAKMNEEMLNNQYYMEQYGEKFKIFVKANNDDALKKAMNIFGKEFASVDYQAGVQGFVEDNKQNFAELEFNSDKYGVNSVVLMATNGEVLAIQFGKILNSQLLRELGAVTVKTICRDGRQVNIPAKTENIESEQEQ